MKIKKAIMAADAFDDMDFGAFGGEDEDPMGGGGMPDDSIDDKLDEMADDIDDIQDDIDEIQEDDTDIDKDNNISNHFIAECEKCHGVFISAITESDQIIDKISGICPLCEEETDQYLKWIIRDIDDSE